MEKTCKCCGYSTESEAHAKQCEVCAKKAGPYCKFPNWTPKTSGSSADNEEKDRHQSTGMTNDDRTDMYMQAVQEKINALVNEFAGILKDIRERHVDNSVCGLCEHDCSCDGYNECPGFENDDCFELKEELRKEWTDVSGLPAVRPYERYKGRCRYTNFRCDDLSCDACIVEEHNPMDLTAAELAWLIRKEINGENRGKADNLILNRIEEILNNWRTVK